mmetsp:Transcript_38511/g.58611  ORF Transcript_38511/g.58611 Transcript_38511/m.58611 type:complete len:149 (-) Transcript_38511:251-697(-)
MPELEDDITKTTDLDQEVKASGFLQQEMQGLLGGGKNSSAAKISKAFDEVAEQLLEPKEDGQEEDDDEGEGEEDGDDNEEEKQEESKEEANDQASDKGSNPPGSDNDEDDNDDESSSEEDLLANQNRKVRFAETFEQRAEEKKQEDEG